MLLQQFYAPNVWTWKEVSTTHPQRLGKKKSESCNFMVVSFPVGGGEIRKKVQKHMVSWIFKGHILNQSQSIKKCFCGYLMRSAFDNVLQICFVSGARLAISYTQVISWSLGFEIDCGDLEFHFPLIQRLYFPAWKIVLGIHNSFIIHEFWGSVQGDKSVYRL